MQGIIDRVTNIATRAAMRGNPIKRIIWIPPETASQDPGGNFAIEYCGPLSGAETPPWEK
jgi:hypothetical protein